VLLTIATTYHPATDLGYLLHKHPDRFQTFELPFGSGHVFYPEADEHRCAATLMLDINAVDLVRGRSDSWLLPSHYVNDRPYVASSFLSVAIARIYGTALAGRCTSHPELVETPMPLEATLSAVPSRRGEGRIRQLFEPLGYEVEVQAQSIDELYPEWGASRYHTVMLRNEIRLQDLLSHIYVLVPVLDADKHYWVGDQEVEKLLRHGEGWLQQHPERNFIARRYLKRRRQLVREALERLAVDEPPADEPAAEEPIGEESQDDALPPERLHEQRLNTTLQALRESGAGTVLDLGCGEGRLLELLLADRRYQRIVGMDVSWRSLERAKRRLHWDDMPEARKQRIELIHGALTYRDSRLAGFDAAAVVEVIEHLDPARLAAFERVLFEHARPATVVLTTPNVEYNTLFKGMEPGMLRHPDHRFEWTRAEFTAWAHRIGDEHGYSVAIKPIGPEDPRFGAPSQLAVFSRIPRDGRQ
jgi:3' terminal RNA ribose 2'-O-methyltransferase Hen1